MFGEPELPRVASTLQGRVSEDVRLVREVLLRLNTDCLAQLTREEEVVVASLL